MTKARRKSGAALCAAVVLVLAAALVATSGSSSSKRAAGSGQDPKPATQGLAARGGFADRLADPVTSSNAGPARARHASGEEEPGAIKAQNPCKLVTRSEAQAIVGRLKVAPQVAPQGPTCIYQPAHLKGYVTLSVQATSLAAARRHGRNPIRVKLRGRRAYCVQQGGLILLVPVSRGRVLNVTAPCPLAARLAAKALPRLRG